MPADDVDDDTLEDDHQSLLSVVNHFFSGEGNSDTEKVSNALPPSTSQAPCSYFLSVMRA
jgi:hypothetical protein